MQPTYIAVSSCAHSCASAALKRLYRPALLEVVRAKKASAT